jgi:hypothetical protein
MTGGAFQRGGSLLVAIHAPAHRKRSDLAHAIRRLHVAVTTLASQARHDVALVGKVNVLREGMDAYPHDGLIIFPVLKDPVDLRIPELHQTVTLIAGRDRRNAGYGRACCG